MDYRLILAPLFDTMTWLIPAMLLIGLLKSRWAKGHIGELLVRMFAHWQLDKQTYRRLHNVTLNTPDGTTQIDHVFLAPYGIFVLETKNMSGWIFGSETQPQWTQKLYKRTFKFQNPLRQNYKHLKALEATLGVNPEHLHSVITFVGGSTFKTEVPANVTQGIGFVRYIKSFQQPVFSEAEVDAMLHSLQTDRRAPTFATHREHVQNLKRRSDPTAERQCPKCGSALLIRTAKSGAKAGQPFWGCSEFPKM
ncbi:NERD domain-containing protein [Pseudomonas sp. PDM16]|nr:NERD domain-containing protein [Pseudomonas sp. PDM16]MBD9412974.1 NERD domain-containing protein [Pseudomonas sp. PDM16]